MGNGKDEWVEGEVDVHEEIKDSILREKLHVPIGLPLLRCFVHPD